jgi:hypothetical protein
MDNAKGHVKATCVEADRLSVKAMAGPTPTTPDPRAERLAQQLRANLRRRKAQSRERDDAGEDKPLPGDSQDQ